MNAMRRLFLGRRTFSLTLLPVLLVLLGGCMQPDRLTAWQRYSESPETPQESLFPEKMAAPEPISLPADGILRLSVEETVLQALRHNRDLRVRRFDPLITATFEELERGAYGTELFGGIEYNREEADETARSTGTRFNVEGKDTTANIGVRQSLPSGTDIEVAVEQRRSISNRAPEQQIARIGLSVTQALLQGFGPSVNLAAVRQAELETVASVHELRGFTEALLAETEIAYWNYVLAAQEIAIFEQSLAVARQQRDDIRQRIEVGMLPEIEVAAARAEVARREQALIDARSQLEERRLSLLRLLGMDFHYDELRLDATSHPETDPRPLTDLGDRLQLASRLRADLREARLRLRQNRLETIVTRNGLLPKLDLFISLGKTGFSDTFPDSFKELDGSTYDFTAGVRLSHYLDKRTAEAKNRAAVADRRQAEAALANLENLVALDVRLGANEVERLRQQIAASRVTSELQTQTLNAEKERFDVGASTALQVAQAQRDHLAARIAEVEAVIDYRIALVRLYLAEGSLLERRGISLDADEDGRPDLLN